MSTASIRLVLTFVGALFASAGCATTPEANLPTITFEKEWLVKNNQRQCHLPTQKVRLNKGPVSGTEVWVKLSLHADRPTELDVFERVLVRWAGERCLDGVSLHSAVTSPGSHLVGTLKASAWVEVDSSVTEQ